MCRVVRSLTGMADPQELEKIVERVVSEVVDGHLAELRRDMVRRVLEEIQTGLPAVAPGEASPTAVLDAAVASVQDATSQAEILRALLDGATKFSRRAVLFVVRAGTGTGWQARGFDDNNALKNFPLDVNKGLSARALRDCTPAAAAAVEFDPGFIKAVRNPADGNALVLPLVVKEKVAALLYADGGTQKDSLLDASALGLLVRSAGLWLEILALRKAGVVAAPEKLAVEPMAAPVAEAPPPAPALEPPTPAAPPPPPVAAPAATAAAVAEPVAEAALSPEEQEVHKKARRHAKLLVDEIILYNKAKVAEGRIKRDLYNRLKEDIEKSRAAYEKKYGNSVASSADYFTKELIRILAQNDASLLGSNFPG